MKKLLLSLLLGFCSLLAISQTPTKALRCGHLLDVRNGKLLSDQVILLQDDKILDIVSAKNFDGKADTIIDLSTQYVLPGLIDAHTHVLLQGDITSDDYADQLLKESIPYRTLRASRSCRIALHQGFTTLRDVETEGAMYADVDLKKAISRDIIEGPRLFVATRGINTVGHYPLSPYTFNWELDLPKGIQLVSGAEEARRAVREQVAHGADWIKIYADRGYYIGDDGHYHSLPNFTQAEISAVTDEATRSRKPVAAHAVTPDGILYAVKAGVRSIEHGFGMNDECIKLMAEKGVFWCPTIYVVDFVAKGRAEEGNPIMLSFMKSFPEIFQKAMKAGVKITYGTDIGGFSWDEPETSDFAYMVRWGMTPTQAIQTATLHGAQLLDMEGKLGEIRKGAYADIIALPKDPTKDIKALDEVNWVMKGGTIYRSH